MKHAKRTGAILFFLGLACELGSEAAFPPLRELAYINPVASVMYTLLFVQVYLPLLAWFFVTAGAMVLLMSGISLARVVRVVLAAAGIAGMVGLVWYFSRYYYLPTSIPVLGAVPGLLLGVGLGAARRA